MRIFSKDGVDIAPAATIEIGGHRLTPDWRASATAEDLAQFGLAVREGPTPPPEPAPAPVPNVVTRRQFARELFTRGIISGPELVAMTATGAPPSVVEAIIVMLPEAEQWIARADFAAATYERGNPLLVVMMTAAGADDAAIDDFFRAAAVL